MMPWSCLILLWHYQTEKIKRHCLDLMPKLFSSICQGAQIRAIWEFCIFVSSKLTYEANFPTFNICRKSMKARNGLKFPSELCFGIINVTKDSFLLNSKVAFFEKWLKCSRNLSFFSTVDLWTNYYNGHSQRHLLSAIENIRSELIYNSISKSALLSKIWSTVKYVLAYLFNVKGRVVLN